MSKAKDIVVKELKPVFTPEQIAARIQELAAEINAEYGDEPMVAVCVLVPVLLGARLYIGISEANFRKIVLGLLTASGVALLASSLPVLLRNL